jgi:hypothetical protein
MLGHMAQFARIKSLELWATVHTCSKDVAQVGDFQYFNNICIAHIITIVSLKYLFNFIFSFWLKINHISSCIDLAVILVLGVNANSNTN